MFHLANMLWVNERVEDRYKKHLHDPQIILHCLYQQLGARAADARNKDDDLNFSPTHAECSWYKTGLAFSWNLFPGPYEATWMLPLAQGKRWRQVVGTEVLILMEVQTHSRLKCLCKRGLRQSSASHNKQAPERISMHWNFVSVFRRKREKSRRMPRLSQTVKNLFSRRSAHQRYFTAFDGSHVGDRLVRKKRETWEDFTSYRNVLESPLC